MQKDIAALKQNQSQISQYGNIVLNGKIPGGNMVTQGSNAIIMSGTGLNSLNNFPANEVTGSSLQSTSSSSYVAVPGSTMTPFTTVGTATNILISPTIGGYNSNFPFTGDYMNVRVVDSLQGPIITFSIGATWYLSSESASWHQNNTSPYAVTSISINLSATAEEQLTALPAIIAFQPGEHTLSLEYEIVGGGTAYIEFFVLYYMILGQNRH